MIPAQTALQEKRGIHERFDSGALEMEISFSATCLRIGKTKTIS